MMKLLKILIKQSLLQAQMGCDVIAPSDMMDGRVGEIRKELDKNGFEKIQILSYAVKYSSSFYGPFRNAVGSKKASLKGDKKTYQMDYSNFDEAIKRSCFRCKRRNRYGNGKTWYALFRYNKRSIKENFKIPVLAYQVSGEYSMLHNAINNKIIK